VAPLVGLIPVSALACDGTGSISDLLTALDWIVEQALRPAIVTLSLGIARGTWSLALEKAVSSIVLQHGISVVVASGNTAGDACDISPASNQAAMVRPVVNWQGKRFRILSDSEVYYLSDSRSDFNFQKNKLSNSRFHFSDPN